MITAKMVKDLRDRTGAGMMDCKKALQECEEDLDIAYYWLKIKGTYSRGNTQDLIDAKEYAHRDKLKRSHFTK